jgi:hypothetical protein
VSRDGEHAAKDVTIVISRKIKPGGESLRLLLPA